MNNNKDHYFRSVSTFITPPRHPRERQTLNERERRETERNYIIIFERKGAKRYVYNIL